MSVSNLVDVSSSFSTRVTTEEGNVDDLQTDSGSFSTRVALLEGSGSITESSASFSTRATTLENANISGGFVAQTVLSGSGTLISGSALSTGSFASLRVTSPQTLTIDNTGTVSGSATSTGSFGRIESTTHIATTVESTTFACFTLISGSAVSTGSFGRVNVAGTLDAGAVTDELAAIIVAQIDDDEIPIAKLAEDSVTYVAGTGLGGGGVAALGNSATINAIGGNGITANANDLEITPAQTTIESIYKADLVIGEDAQTQIDFETANEIHFDVNNIELLNLTGAKISGSSVIYWFVW